MDNEKEIFEAEVENEEKEVIDAEVVDNTGIDDIDNDDIAKVRKKTRMGKKEEYSQSQTISFYRHRIHRPKLHITK